MQLDRPAARAAVAVKLGLVDTSGDVHLGQAIAIAVKRGHAAAHQKFTLALKAALQPGGIGFFDEAGDGG